MHKHYSDSPAHHHGVSRWEQGAHSRSHPPKSSRLCATALKQSSSIPVSSTQPSDMQALRVKLSKEDYKVEASLDLLRGGTAINTCLNTIGRVQVLSGHPR